MGENDKVLGLNQASVSLLLAIIELCFKYGPKVIAGIIEVWGQKEIAVEDLQKLRIEKEPEEFKPEVPEG